jgi:dUTP pyrophosphatase
MVQVKVALAGGGARVPTRATAGSAAWDLYAARSASIPAGEIHSVSTGVKVEIPQGFFGLVRPRSGLAKRGLPLCSSGVVDPDYRGELRVVLINHSDQLQFVNQGDRVAQLLFVPLPEVVILEVGEEDLSETDRGQGGFGSTGV